MQLDCSLFSANTNSLATYGAQQIELTYLLTYLRVNIPMYSIPFLTSKTTIKIVDDLDENWYTTGLCRRAYVYQNWRFYVLPFVHNTLRDVRMTHEYQNVRTYIRRLYCLIG